MVFFHPRSSFKIQHSVFVDWEIKGFSPATATTASGPFISETGEVPGVVRNGESVLKRALVHFRQSYLGGKHKISTNTDVITNTKEETKPVLNQHQRGKLLSDKSPEIS